MHDTASLHERFQQARATGFAAIHDFFGELEKTPEDPTVVWFLVEVLERLTKDDSVSTPMSAINQLRKRGKADVLPRVKAAHRRMPVLVGAAWDYRDYVGYIIAGLEQPPCLCRCQFYALHHAHNREVGLEPESSRDENAFYTVVHKVRCQECGRRWEVAEMDADDILRKYYRWSPLPAEP